VAGIIGGYKTQIPLVAEERLLLKSLSLPNGKEERGQ
jgi:hypothetical protein